MSAVSDTFARSRGLLIGGEEVPAISGRTTDNVNPITGEVFNVVPAAGVEDVTRAVDAAQEAFEEWARTPPSVRRAILLRSADLLDERMVDFREIMLAETGGTRAWADFNVAISVQMLRQGATMATEPQGQVLSSDRTGELSLAMRQPAGVYASFTPWNGPLILCSRAIAVALATGNSIVMRPSEDSPITAAYFMADALADAGLPAGVVNVVTNERADAPQVVEALIGDERVRRVGFTGSTAVGRIVGELSGKYVKPVILELGGKAPVYVCDDADVEYAARGIAFARFMNSGQICLAADRIIVHAAVAEQFTQSFVQKVSGLGEGDPRDPATIVGPLINARTASRVAGLVTDAVGKGARVLCGGGVPTRAFHPATVLDGITPDMQIYSQEVFGPVATILTVNDDDEAVALANDTEFGLSSAVYTEDMGRGLGIARRLRHGAVHVNDHSVADEAEAPVGGIKNSGFGHFNSQWGAEFFTETRWITLASQHSAVPFFSSYS
jgi:acyl-CoA reductase-like NAD-dependent aldehyde dehydrogenase